MAEHYLIGLGYEHTNWRVLYGINQLKEKSVTVKVVSEVVDGYQNEVISQIRRHVDDVGSVYTEETGDNQYTIEGDDVNYWDTFEDALLYKVDPDGELESLDTSSPYTVTLSRKENDTVKGSDTCRTQYSCKSMQEVIGNLWQNPYIHNLVGFTEQQVLDLHELSKRIVNLKEDK